MARPRRDIPWVTTRNGIFYAAWYDPEAKTRRSFSLRTADRDEAEVKFAEFLSSGKEIRAPRIGKLSVTVALDDYLAEHAEVNIADPTRQRDAAAHLKAFFGDKAIEDIDIEASEAYAEARYAGRVGGGARRKKLAARKGSPSTVRRELNVLVAASNHALKRKRVEKVCIVHLPPERRLGQDDEAPYYTEEEVEAIFAEARKMGDEREAEREELARAKGEVFEPDPMAHELEWFVRLLYSTGARRRSIENLTRAQVKLATRRVLLQKPGKISTKKRQPIVPIFKAMEEPLAKLLEHGGGERLFRCADFYRPYVRLCQRLGIDEVRQRPHIMRHTRASHLLQAGKSIYDVAKLLGDTVATVDRVYGHHSHDHLARSLED